MRIKEDNLEAENEALRQKVAKLEAVIQEMTALHNISSSTMNELDYIAQKKKMLDAYSECLKAEAKRILSGKTVYAFLAASSEELYPTVYLFSSAEKARKTLFDRFCHSAKSNVFPLEVDSEWR